MHPEIRRNFPPRQNEKNKHQLSIPHITSTVNVSFEASITGICKTKIGSQPEINALKIESLKFAFECRAREVVCSVYRHSMGIPVRATNQQWFPTGTATASIRVSAEFSSKDVFHERNFSRVKLTVLKEANSEHRFGETPVPSDEMNWRYCELPQL